MQSAAQVKTLAEARWCNGSCKSLPERKRELGCALACLRQLARGRIVSVMAKVGVCGVVSDERATHRRDQSAGPQVRWLLRRTIDGGWLEEPSVKLRGGRLEADRRLFSFGREALLPASRRQLYTLLEALQMPGPESLLTHFSDCVAVHLGVEGVIRKCYLEFPRNARPQPDLVYLAAKWQGEGLRYDRYLDRAPLPRAKRRALISAVAADDIARSAAEALLEIAERADPDGEPPLLEIRGTDDARRSVDLNLADTGRSLASFGFVLAPVLERVGAAGEAFLRANADAQLGHFALGRDERGEGFVTLYFGAHRA